MAQVDRLRLVVQRVARHIRTNTSGSLPPSQIFVLASVVRLDDPTVGELAAAERVRPPTISRVVTSLESAGLVERRGDPEDGRHTRVVVTPAGMELMERLRAEGRTWLLGRLQQLSLADQATVESALPALELLLGPDDAASKTPADDETSASTPPVAQ